MAYKSFWSENGNQLKDQVGNREFVGNKNYTYLGLKIGKGFKKQAAHPPGGGGELSYKTDGVLV